MEPKAKSHRTSEAVEFRSVSGDVLACGFVSSDATVADFNKILKDREYGYGLPAGSTYVNGTTSIATEDRETPVWGGTWTVVRNSASGPVPSSPDYDTSYVSSDSDEGRA